ncbi:MAG: NUDIX hydrolase [Phycisphaeraceae bacterium]|nr:NUDIX hydrolase [Phycisphaeraceae bacterium]
MSQKPLEAGKQVYRGPRFEVRKVFLPGRAGVAEGGKVERDAVVAADAVVILPLLDRQTVVMIRNERFVVGDWLWELPAGTMEEGEDPLTSAGRELEEETGYKAGRLRAMTRFFPSPGLCTEYMHAYVADELEHVGQDLDENERIQVHPMAMAKALGMVRSGEIRDGKTIAALLFHEAFVKVG